VKENRMAETPLQQLQAHGQSVWIDYLSRPFIENGELAGLVREGVTGVTSNPTIFQGAIADGDAYDEQLREVLQTVTDPKEVFLALARNDIPPGLRAAARRVGARRRDRDGWVSLEVDPSLAYDTEATVAEAARLHEMVERPNLFVKIPATEPACRRSRRRSARGIPVNVTLIFSLERHRKVAKAYIAGLKRLVENGGDPSTVASVASFFVSRVDTEADKRLDAIGGHDELKGTLAIANAKLAYRTYQEVFSGAEWEALAAKGATPQRCLWASTSTKNPEYRDVIYVEELIGPHTVNTMPRETVEAVLDHGRVEETLTGDVEGRRADARGARAGRDRLRRRGGHARARGGREVRQELRGPHQGDRGKRDAMVAA
jgi:transaldolase